VSEALLEARGIVKSFGGVRALRGVDFAVHPSEVAALVGDNGAGKSTLVKILSGTLAPDSGEYGISSRRVPLPSTRPLLLNSTPLSRPPGAGLPGQQRGSPEPGSGRVTAWTSTERCCSCGCGCDG
jgi:energy-coupling factor transporter ATP-binding protein EcfA2